MKPWEFANLTDQDIFDFLTPLPKPEPRPSRVVARIQKLKRRGWSSEQINQLFHKESAAKRPKHQPRKRKNG